MTCKSIITTFHSFLNAAAQNPVRPSEGATEGGCGGYFAAPERIQKEASPAAPLVQSRIPKKTVSQNCKNQTPSTTLLKIKNIDQFGKTKIPALIFAKTLSACGGSRETP